MVLIDTKGEQLAAIVNAYQALGGGVPPILMSETAVIIPPLPHLSGPPSPVGAAAQPGPPPPPGPPLPPGAAAPARAADLARAGKLTGPGKASDGSRAAASTTLNIESFMGSIMCLGVSVSNSVMRLPFVNDY